MHGHLPHRLGIVAYEMEGLSTGVGRYLAGLLSGLAQTSEPVTYVLLFRGAPFEHPLWARADGVYGDGTDGTDGPRFEARFDNRPASHPVLWEQIRLARRLRHHRLDALFSPSYSLPEGLRVPSLVTLHDLSFEHLPQDFGWLERWRRRLLARRAAHQASRVLTDTGAMGRDVQTTYNVPAGKLGVVPLAVGRRFLDAPMAGDATVAEADETVHRELGIRAPYLLVLGSLLPRRHIDRIIAAFQDVAAKYPDLQLVISGHNALPDPQALQTWIHRSPVARRIHHLGYVPEASLLPLYRGAALTFYVSTYEGFGIPPLESLALGVPAVVSSGLALDDLWPDYPLRLRHLSVEDLARTALEGLQLGPARKNLADEGRRRVAKLTWRHCAETFLRQVALAMDEDAAR